MGWVCDDNLGKAEGYKTVSLVDGWLGSLSFCNEYGGFMLTSFCPAFAGRTVISSKVYIGYEHRGKGYGKKQHKDRLKIARKAGFDTMLACVRKDNKVENHILEIFGWEILTNLDDFHRLWKKDLTKVNTEND